MTGTPEAFSRVRIDALLQDAGWNLTDGVSALFEHALGDGSRADYVLCDRSGRPMAVVEAKRASVDPITAQDQGIHYAEPALGNAHHAPGTGQWRAAHEAGPATARPAHDGLTRITHPGRPRGAAPGAPPSAPGGRQARSTSNAARLRSSRLNSTPMRWTGCPKWRYLSA